MCEEEGGEEWKHNGTILQTLRSRSGGISARVKNLSEIMRTVERKDSRDATFPKVYVSHDAATVAIIRGMNNLIINKLLRQIKSHHMHHIPTTVRHPTFFLK